MPLGLSSNGALWLETAARRDRCNRLLTGSFRPAGSRAAVSTPDRRLCPQSQPFPDGTPTGRS
jgi:hypothetical protein